MNECLRFHGSLGRKNGRKSPLLCIRVRVFKDLRGTKMDENVFVGREKKKNRVTCNKTAGAESIPARWWGLVCEQGKIMQERERKCFVNYNAGR